MKKKKIRNKKRYTYFSRGLPFVLRSIARRWRALGVVTIFYLNVSTGRTARTMVLFSAQHDGELAGPSPLWWPAKTANYYLQPSTYVYFASSGSVGILLLLNRVRDRRGRWPFLLFSFNQLPVNLFSRPVLLLHVWSSRSNLFQGQFFKTGMLRVFACETLLLFFGRCQC